MKRIDNVIRVFAELKEVPARLLLVGDGPERQKAENLCRELALRRNTLSLANRKP